MLTLLFRFLALFPLRALWALGALGGRLAWWGSRSYRSKFQRNLHLAGYTQQRMRSDAIAQAGRMAAELPAVWFYPELRLFAHCLSDTHVVLEQAIEAARADGRGLLFMTPHLGCFEITCRYIARHVPMTILFKPSRIAAVDQLLREARNRSTVCAVPADLAGVRALLRCLRRGEAVGLLPDQVPTEGGGQLAEFFGQPALTMTLPEGLVRRAQPRVLFAVGERRVTDGVWQLHFLDHQGECTPAAINRAMEGLIRRWPDQYLWSYNRFRGAPPAGEAA
jgi:KDO2-lipid IV(A) lauroyltransferase